MGLRTKMRKVPICQLVCGYLPTFYTNRHEEMSVSETTRDRVLEQHLGSETHESLLPTTSITRCKNNIVVGLLSCHTGDRGEELLAIQEECQHR